MTLTDTDRILRFLSRSGGKMLHMSLRQKCQYSMNVRTLRTALGSLKARSLITEQWDVEGHSYTLTAQGHSEAQKALEQKRA